MKFGLERIAARKIARRYARAFFNEVTRRDLMEPVAIDFMLIGDMLKNCHEFATFARDPEVSHEQCASIFSELFLNRIHPVTQEFLLFLHHKERLHVIEEIIEAYEELFHTARGVSKIDLISAHPLTSEQVDEICQKLKERWNRGIFAQAVIDPGLLGGFQVKFGDRIIDLSIKTHLENFRKAVVHG